MASCITSQWASSAPQVKLTVTQSAITGDSATLTWTLQYVASSAPSTSSARSYRVVIAGTTVKSGTYDINGKTGTLTIASGTKTITKTTASQTISFSCSMAWNLTWDGVYKGTLSASSSITIAAKTSYPIKYDSNGGSGAPAAQTKWYDTALTLSSTKPTKSGHTFSKWNTESDGSGASYMPGQRYTTNTSLYLYAQYTANTYTITYNANGGTGGPVSQTKTYGITLTLSTITPTRAGYTFLGWASMSTATTAAYLPGASYTGNGNRTLYAVWEVAYFQPIISEATVSRCDSSGNLDEAGTYLKVEFDWITQSSDPTLTIKWKSNHESEYTETTSPGSGTSDKYNSVLGSGAISTDYTYSVIITVNDGTKTTTSSHTVSSSRPTINALPGGRGIAFGARATEEELFDVYYNARFRHDVEVIGDISAASASITNMYDAKGMLIRNGLTAYESAGIDPDTTLEHEILTATKTPNGSFMYIITYFYADKTTESNRMQIAIPYDKKEGPYYRYYSGVWNDWIRFGSKFYSTAETPTGDVWLGGLPVYRRTFSFAVGDTGTNVVIGTIASFKNLVNIYGDFVRSNTNSHIPLNFYYSSSNYVNTAVNEDGGIQVRTSTAGTATVTVEYTKIE